MTLSDWDNDTIVSCLVIYFEYFLVILLFILKTLKREKHPIATKIVIVQIILS